MDSKPMLLGEGLSQKEKKTLQSKTQNDPRLAQHSLSTDVIGKMLTQKVIKAPARSIELKTENEKFESSDKNYTGSLKQLESLIKSIDDADMREAFSNNFSDNIFKMRNILKDKPFFAQDFHMVVDESGKIYNTDLDGRFVYYSWAPQNDPKSKIMAAHVESYLTTWDQFAKDLIKTLA